MNKKVFITGAAGYVGVNLANYLFSKDYQVVATDLQPRPRDLEEQIKFIQFDLLAGRLEKHLKDIDTIFHTAAVINYEESFKNPKKYHDVNVTGTLNILEAARHANVRRVVFSSSMSAYLPDNPYSLTKLIGEEYVKLYARSFNLETVSLRYFNFYGPTRENQNFKPVINLFLEQNAKKKVLIVNKEESRTFLYLYDLLEANELAGKSKKVGSGEVIDIAGAKIYKIIDVAKIISKDFKIKIRKGKSRNIGAIKPNLAIAKKLLNWAPKIGLKEGIEIIKEQSK